MENENKLSIFGWLIILAMVVSICYWFSMHEPINATLINVLSISAKSLILVVLFISQFIAYEKYQNSLFIYLNVITLILSFEILIFNSAGFKEDTVNLPACLATLAIILGGISLIVAFVGLCSYIAELMDPETGKLQALEDLLKQNLITKLMFKQPKKEKPIKNVKM